MKVFMSVDMEGITGVSVGGQVGRVDGEYQRFRKLMTADTNAAIEGALAAGATEILVNDSHGSMTNILIEELNPKARLLSGAKKHYGMMQGISDAFDVLFFVGYHDRDGADDGVLNHTYMGGTVYEIRVNGVPASEMLVNAGLAGHFGVPIGLVTGDHVICRSAAQAFPAVETAPVKEAVNRYAADCLTPHVAHELIRAGAAQAVAKAEAGAIQPYTVSLPVTFEIEFKSTGEAYTCELVPQFRRVGNRTISFAADDYLSAYRLLWAALALGRSGTPQA